MIVTDQQLKDAGRPPETMVIEEILKGLNVTVFYSATKEEPKVILTRVFNQPHKGIYSTIAAGQGRVEIDTSEWYLQVKIMRIEHTVVLMQIGEGRYNMNFMAMHIPKIIKRCSTFVKKMFPIDEESEECKAELQRCKDDPEYFYNHYWKHRVEQLQGMVKKKLETEVSSEH